MSKKETKETKKETKETKKDTRIVRKARTVGFNLLDLSNSYLETWAIEAHAANNIRKRKAIKEWHEENDKFLKTLEGFKKDNEALSETEARLENEFYEQVIGLKD